MATREQKIAALETALAQASGKSEAEIFLIMTEALAKVSEGEAPSPSALFLLQAAPMTDAQKTKALELQEQSLTLARSVLCPSS